VLNRVDKNGRTIKKVATEVQCDHDYWSLNGRWLLDFEQSLFFCRFSVGSACVHERLQ